MRTVGHGPTWTLELDPWPVTFDNYFVESCKAAEEIYDLKEGPLHVMYSGGVDSEYALSVFLSLGIPVTPVIIRMGDYNSHDIDYAFKFCAKHNLKPAIIDIDFKEFVESGKFAEVNKIVKSSAFGYVVTSYASGLIQGSVICGEGHPYIKKNEETSTWDYRMWEFEWSVQRYMDAKGIDGTTLFNGYTQEMAASFLMDPQMKELADNKVPGKLGSMSSKWIIYNRHSNFNLEERKKYNGYEKILESSIMNHPALLNFEDTHKQYDGQFTIDYYEFIKDLNNANKK
jgi:hypothetical protein